jgi:hypothetical protein
VEVSVIEGLLGLGGLAPVGFVNSFFCLGIVVGRRFQHVFEFANLLSVQHCAG